MDNTSRYTQARFITLLGAAKNILLSFLKIFFGITGHSHALLADGVHSLADLLIDGMVLIASRFGSKAADSDHPYGHGRIETAFTFLLAFILMLTGVGIIVDAGNEIFEARSLVQPNFYVLYVALFSVLINEVLYLYTRRVGEKIHSNLLITNAWHHRSDSLSSLVVLVGVGCAWFGLKKFDAIAAVIVGCMIIKMAWEFAWKSVRELVDTGLDDADVVKLEQIIKAVPGVVAIHQLRTRLVGGAIFLDVHIQVNSMISVSEGHYISQQVHFRVQKAVSKIKDVTVHVDPEDDEVEAPSYNLPSREALVGTLKQRWQGLLTDELIDSVLLHYLAGKITIELILPSTMAVPNFVEQLQQAITDITAVTVVKVSYRSV